ncbi:MAG TPA: hypothetical protein VFQ45_03040 [Longimicrobium sp.]|nr:hypothetical protein [Longimicrobium sp.]
MRWSLRAAAAAAVLAPLLGACTENGAGADLGGEYRGVVESPFFNEGAAVVELEGPGLLEVTSAMPLFWATTEGEVTRLVLINDPDGNGGPLTFRVVMEEGFGPPTGTVVEVVDGEDRPRDFIETYRVNFTR